MRHKFKIAISAIILSAIVLQSAISKTDRDVITNDHTDKIVENIPESDKLPLQTKKTTEYFDEQNFLNEVLKQVEAKYVHEKSELI